MCSASFHLPQDISTACLSGSSCSTLPSCTHMVSLFPWRDSFLNFNICYLRWVLCSFLKHIALFVCLFYGILACIWKLHFQAPSLEQTYNAFCLFVCLFYRLCKMEENITKFAYLATKKKSPSQNSYMRKKQKAPKKQ